MDRCSDCFKEAEDLYICDGSNCDLVICSDCLQIREGKAYCYACNKELTQILLHGHG